jgi:hypothetical protein
MPIAVADARRRRMKSYTLSPSSDASAAACYRLFLQARFCILDSIPRRDYYNRTRKKPALKVGAAAPFVAWLTSSWPIIIMPRCGSRQKMRPSLLLLLLLLLSSVATKIRRNVQGDSLYMVTTPTAEGKKSSRRLFAIDKRQFMTGRSLDAVDWQEKVSLLETKALVGVPWPIGRWNDRLALATQDSESKKQHYCRCAPNTSPTDRPTDRPTHCINRRDLFCILTAAIINGTACRTKENKNTRHEKKEQVGLFPCTILTTDGREMEGNKAVSFRFWFAVVVDRIIM